MREVKCNMKESVVSGVQEFFNTKLLPSQSQPCAYVEIYKPIVKTNFDIQIQPKTMDLRMRLQGITTEFVGFISRSLVLRSIVLG